MKFVWDKLTSEERLGGRLEHHRLDEQYKNTEFDKDYRRILSSASFRRLQDKTQVFPLDKNDFIRTRLTHSLETASIAKQLGVMASEIIEQKEANCSEGEKDSNKIIRSDNIILRREIYESLKIIPNILHSAGLLHDIGNPPFGHFGETVIGDWFKINLSNYKFKETPIANILRNINNGEPFQDLIQFEGNGQALRLVTKLHFLDSEYGLNLTVSTLNTLIKYPCSSLESKANHKDIKYHKLGYFYADREIIDMISLITGTYKENNGVKEYLRHPLTFLLEAADDIAYTTADLEDAYKKGIFSLENLVTFLEQEIDSKDKGDKLYSPYKYSKICLEKLIELSNKNETIYGRKDTEWYAIQNWMDYIRSWLMYCVSYGFERNYESIMQGTYKKELIEGTNLEHMMKTLKRFTQKYVFPERSIITLELAAKTIIEFLLEKFIPAIIYYDYKDEFENTNYKQTKADKKLTSLLSQNHVENYLKEAAGKSEEEKLYLRLLLVTDFISGMTDTYAKQLYQELNGIY